ncbi:MAG: flagellar biosynthetic protein FliO, partial [Opitutales bacterium]
MRNLIRRAARLARTALIAALFLGPIAATAVTDPEPEQIITPRQNAATATTDDAAAQTPAALRGPTLLAVTAVVATIAFLIMRRLKKGGLGNRLSQSATGAIEICRTRSLGSKQYLVVVQVEGKRMLLGVGPGFITNLSELEAENYSIPYERKGSLPKPAPKETENPD